MMTENIKAWIMWRAKYKMSGMKENEWDWKRIEKEWIHKERKNDIQLCRKQGGGMREQG